MRQVLPLYVRLHIKPQEGDKQQDHRHREVDHVPAERGHPKGGAVDSTHKLAVFGIDRTLLDEEQDEAGGQESHAENHVERDSEPLRTRDHLVRDFILCCSR